MTIELHIGIDDTDSPKGGCTTYTGAILADELEQKGVELEDFPWIVRLNPNVPWKTRGNAAVAIHALVAESRLEEIKENARRIVEQNSDMSQRRTDPALAFLEGRVPPELNQFYLRALCDIIPVDEARQVAEQTTVEPILLKGSRGLIGAMAALGAPLREADHTFEIIAYRKRENCGTMRKVDPESVGAMNEKYSTGTFNNVDQETGRVLVTPHGPDPVLFGIRGEDPDTLRDAYDMIRTFEPVDKVTVFRTNQGTDAHLWRQRTTKLLQPYQSAVVTGTVTDYPLSLRGGHVFFQISDPDGSVDCAAYEPTGPFRSSVLSLVPGDLLTAYGGVRPMPNGMITLNLEKIKVHFVTEKIEWHNRKCEVCETKCESMGKGQGVRCRKCGRRYSTNARVMRLLPRSIQKGFYIPPSRANRHLTKPASRLSL